MSVLLSGCGPKLPTESTDPPVDNAEFCVLSFNTRLISQSCHTSNCEEEVELVGDFICGLGDKYDVINFQEVFESDARDRLIEKLEDCGYLLFKYDDTYHGTKNSGLLTASKKYIKKTFYEEYIDESGTDIFSTKGFLHTKIEMAPGCYYDIINTHLQSSGTIVDITSINLKPDSIRTLQLEQLNRYIGRMSEPSSGIIIAGDFNIEWDSDEKNKFETILNAKTAFELSGDNGGISHPDDNSLLDYFVLMQGDYNEIYYKVRQIPPCKYGVSETDISVKLNLLTNWDFDSIVDDEDSIPFVLQPFKYSICTSDHNLIELCVKVACK